MAPNGVRTTIQICCPELLWSKFTITLCLSVFLSLALLPPPTPTPPTPPPKHTHTHNSLIRILFLYQLTTFSMQYECSNHQALSKQMRTSYLNFEITCRSLWFSFFRSNISAEIPQEIFRKIPREQCTITNTLVKVILTVMQKLKQNPRRCKESPENILRLQWDNPQTFSALSLQLL